MRCDLAASLLHRPPLLFLDEPTIGLDIVAKANVREFLQEINRQEGTTVLLTTHDLADIETLCRRVIVIDHGRLLFDGALDELRDRILPVTSIVFDVKRAPEPSRADLRTASRPGRSASHRYRAGRRPPRATRRRRPSRRSSTASRSPTSRSRSREVEEVVKRIYREGIS